MLTDLCNSIFCRNAPVELSMKKLLKTSTHSSSRKEVCAHCFDFYSLCCLLQLLLISSVRWTDTNCLSIMFTKFPLHPEVKPPSEKMQEPWKTEGERTFVFMESGCACCLQSSLCKYCIRWTGAKTSGGFDISVQREEKQASKYNDPLFMK